MIEPLPDITAVNFSDPCDTGTFVAALCRIGGQLGMAHPGFKPTAESNAVRRLADKAVRRIHDQLPGMTPADAFMMMSPYELAYRFAYMAEPDRATINRYTLAAFDAMIHGDRSVDQYAMYQAIVQAVRRRDKAYTDRPLLWLTLTEEQWYKEAKRGFDESNLTPYDIVSRLSILLRADLSAYEGHHQPTFKTNLLTRYHHYLTPSTHHPLPHIA